MPEVTIKMLEGRTLEQKRALAKKVTEAIVETTGATAEAVMINIEELKKEHLAKAGVLYYDK